MAVESLMLKMLLINVTALATPIHYGIDDAEMVDAKQAKMVHLHLVCKIVAPVRVVQLICLFNEKNEINKEN